MPSALDQVHTCCFEVEVSAVCPRSLAFLFSHRIPSTCHRERVGCGLFPESKEEKSALQGEENQEMGNKTKWKMDTAAAQNNASL